MEKFEIIEFTKSYEEQFINLFNNLYSQELSKYYNWKYSKTPNNFRLLAISKEKNEVAGNYSVIHWDILMNQKRISAVQSVDTITNPNYRRRSIFETLGKKTLLKVKESGYLYAFGFTYYKGAALRGFIDKLDWIKVHRLPDLIFPINFKELSLHYTKNKIFAFIIRFFLRTYSTIFSFIRPKRNNNVVQNEWNFQGFEDCFKKSIIYDKKITSYRSIDFIKWRFFKKPNTNYIPLYITNLEDQVICYTILAIREKIGYIVDFYSATNQKVMSKFIKSIIKFFKHKEVIGIIFRCNCKSLIRLFIKNGFIFQRSKQAFIVHDLWGNCKNDEQIFNVKNWYITFTETDHI